MMGYGMMGYGMAVAMFLWWAILLGGIFLGCYGITLLIRNKNNTTNSNEALEKLKVRYVMGEISQEEYTEKKQLLQVK
ncbi:SHOCT domain-containing protein [Dehalobacterium formicoaceticum]|uniref:SHOCT domain-containing protein n=1 Tax=Dehalobacterium formicoaceticum TaxID=51515 RepID=A0ABT1Y4H4_9FIRM|nr:SHOCT domain-containing protein [Dehalobacterium formicoaceticum]MCR6545780.1 SHOCT domain-containing protein [Dehalobacterium formicoaceticum]